MGLKSGSRDAGLEEDEDGEEPETEHEEAVEEPGQATEPSTESTGPAETAESESDAGGGSGRDAGARSDIGSGGPVSPSTARDRPSMDSIPYVLRRSRVNEGRDQVPFFLREAVLDGEKDLQDSLETMLGEEVYKSDYREAAMVVAQRKPELVAEVLREWGYDLD